MEHLLKIRKLYFDDILAGRKTFELRKFDRDFKCDDTLILRVWENGEYSGEAAKCIVKYLLDITDFIKTQEKWCILGIHWLWYYNHFKEDDNDLLCFN